MAVAPHYAGYNIWHTRHDRHLADSGVVAHPPLFRHLLQLQEHQRVQRDEQDEGDETHQEKVEPDLRVLIQLRILYLMGSQTFLSTT